MPRKQRTLTDEERAKRIRETAREIGTDESPKAFERAFEKVVGPKQPSLSKPKADRPRLSAKRSSS
jgi:hypothetical protein